VFFCRGFEAAKTLKTQTNFKELEARALLEQMDKLGEQLGPVVSAIASAYGLLTAARNAVKGAIDNCGSNLLSVACILNHASETDFARTVVLLSFPDVAVAALERLTADVTAGCHPEEALRAFFTVATPAMLVQPVSPDTLGQRLRSLGVPSILVTALLKKDPFALDDGGVRAAVEAAASAAAAHPAEPTESAEDRRAALSAARQRHRHVRSGERNFDCAFSRGGSRPGEAVKASKEAAACACFASSYAGAVHPVLPAGQTLLREVP